MRLLLSEGSSLTSREFVNVLGPAGHHIEILDPDPFCLCRFSRWTRRVHKCPIAGKDPLRYIESVNRLIGSGRYDVLVPTHEQAWLFAAARHDLHPSTRVALPSMDAFQRLQSKIEFARTADVLGLPQPLWRIITRPDQLNNCSFPCYLKLPFSTAGIGVRRVEARTEAGQAFDALSSEGGGAPLMLQSAVEGDYGQVQAVFDHGLLVAAHTSVQTAIGFGQSAAGRLSVDHAFARRDIERLGRHVGWHGGLTLDYLFRGSEYFYIECNPRTVEPMNAAISGVNLPELQIALSWGDRIDGLRIGKQGIRTHGALACLLGTADKHGSRTALIQEMFCLMTGRGQYRGSRESLTPFTSDWVGIVPLIVVAIRLLIAPRNARELASHAVRIYSVPNDALAAFRKMA